MRPRLAFRSSEWQRAERFSKLDRLLAAAIAHLFVRLHMRNEHQEPPEPPNRRVGWSIYGAAMVAACLACAALAPWGLIPMLSGGAWFGIAIALGGVTALVVNLLRPRYENAVGKWRSFYDFLLRQMPAPD